MSSPRRRDGRWFGGPLRTAAVIVLVAVFLFPSLADLTLAGEDDVPMVCSCGCGKVKGECCCSAPRVSRLEFGCSNSSDPNDPLDGTSTGKIIGPPEAVGPMLPLPTDADLGEPAYAFAGLDPLPEIPPPRI
jgi:hypothetical protein